MGARSSNVRLTSAIGLATAIACGGDSTAPDAEPCAVESVAMRIAPGSLDRFENGSLRPRFEWTPACGAGGLIVDRMVGDDRQLRWVIEARAGRTLPSGVRYGYEPSGASTQVGAFPIERQAAYRAILYRLPDHVALAIVEFGT